MPSQVVNPIVVTAPSLLKSYFVESKYILFNKLNELFKLLRKEN